MGVIKNFESIITSNRLRLAPMLAAHAAEMLPILSDRQLYRFTAEEPPESSAALETRYSKLESRQSPDGSQQWLNWLVSLAENSLAVGYVQATVLESHADIAWVIGSKWQGSGYASEAAAALVKWLRDNGVQVIRCCINADHIASQRVAANAGFNKSKVIEDGEDVWLL